MSNHRNFVLFAFSLIFIFTTACAQNTSESDTVDKNSSEYKIYKKNQCISCHGTDLEGRMGPLSNLQQVGSRLEKEEIRSILLQGKEETHMPGYEGIIEEENIEILSDWLSEME
ncbi:c-type cytochrome [Chengkuizengella marina]|nr:cytochrome c [Chengkuizengella marina]